MAHRIKKLSQNANFALKSSVPPTHKGSQMASPYKSYGSLWLTPQGGAMASIFIRTSLFFKSFWNLTRFTHVSVLVAIVSALFFFSTSFAFTGDALPQAQTMGLPFEGATGRDATYPIAVIIRETIKYIGLFAILVISWGGIQFLTSIGNDEKVKHAKQTIMYALIWVVLSVVAYTIVDIINSLRV